jgi:hypothetical protein
VLRDRSLSIHIWVTARRLSVGDESEPSLRMVRGCGMGVSAPEVRRKDGCAALRNSKIIEAESHLRKAVKQWPKYLAAWVVLGQVMGL